MSWKNHKAGQEKQVAVLHRLISTILCLLVFAFSFGQGNPAARYEIDAKRQGVNPFDKDALPRSREFTRLDSTYYVGYMYEGMYKFDKSSDYLGYRNAIAPLRKSFMLLQKDYGNGLRTIYLSPAGYGQYMNKYSDLLQIANALREAYDDIERPDSVMWVLDNVASYNFPKDHLNINTTKAWTFHRNRFYTSDKFSFLKNSVEDNEREALRYCYNAFGQIDANRAKNDAWFGTMQAETDRLNVYHYLALLHAYNKNYDSADYYYREMAAIGFVSWNNYGSLKHEVGEIAVAKQYCDRDRFKFQQKMLREPDYFLPLLNIYGAKTKEAINICKETISESGSTPGFGWYNIALCRSYMYDGQLDSAEYAIQKASDFKEVHIGTTLTQSQYDFTVNLLKLQLIVRKISLVKFENKGWWYSPASLFKIAGLKFQKLMNQYVLVNQLAANPERDRMVYDLFCGESTTTFDEAFYLLKDFSPSYFVKKYENYQKTDNRRNIQRYFRLFKNKMRWIGGDEDEAFEDFKDMVREIELDTENEKLFLARLYESLAVAFDDDGDDKNRDFYSNALLEEYPQLVPFSEVRPKVKFTFLGVEDATVKEVIEEVKDCRIDQEDDASPAVATAFVAFSKTGNRYQAEVTVKSGTGKTIVDGDKMVFKEPKGVGKELALRMFGKGGAPVFERIDAGN